MLKEESMTKGIILFLLGIIITYITIILHFKDIFTFIGFIVIVVGAYIIFINLGVYEKYNDYVSHKSFQENLKNSQKTDMLSKSYENNSILNKVTKTNEKVKFKFKDPNKLKNQSKPKTLFNHKSSFKLNNSFKKDVNDKHPKFSMPKNKNEIINKPKFNKKPYMFNTPKNNPQIYDFETQNPNPFVFTPNYERPSTITRRPVKKEVNSPKTQKLSKIKPTIPINQLSKTLGLEKKEDKELIKLHKMLSDDNDLNLKDDANQKDIFHSNNSLENILNSPTTKNTNINTNTSTEDIINDGINKHEDNSEPDAKNNDLRNKEIISNLIEDEFNHANNEKNFITELNEIEILCGSKNLKFNEILEKLSKEVKKEIDIEIPNLKILSDKILVALKYLNAKIIIEKFDVKDMYYSFIVSSLLENKNITIRTVDSVDSINIIIDNDYALLVSKPFNSEIGVGAVFTEEKEVSSVKDAFDLLWKISEKL
ncbi:MAG: hypothetical protein LBR15_03195 [Methanobrevibacter sp.]|nr:hypothetical protein [Candidatus Methanovirga australis]